MRSRWLCWTLVSLFVVTPLTAQDTSHVSLVIGQRGPGVLVSVSDNAAIRADVTFSRASSGDFHSQTETVGLSGLLYLGRWDALRSYVGPRVSYSHSSSSGSSTAKQWSGQAFFGTEYALSRRFGLFGETGLSYTRTSNSHVGITGEITSIPAATSWSTTENIGVLFRF
jgi:hypothetical protein